MAYYQREEQETIYNYDVIGNYWRIYSSYPPDMRRLLERGDIKRFDRDDDGRVIAVDGYVESNQIRLFKPIGK